MEDISVSKNKKRKSVKKKLDHKNQCLTTHTTNHNHTNDYKHRNSNASSLKTISIKLVPPTQEEYTQQINIANIEKSIDDLNNSDFSKITDDEIFSKLTTIFSFNYDNCAYMMPMQVPYYVVPENTLLYRIRTINSVMKQNEDLWFPPAKFITHMGRLNDINEPILYLTNNILTALKETRINAGQGFYLLFYKVTKPIKLVSISPSYGINSKYKEIEKIIGLFLTKEFSRFIPNNENNRYKVSNIIGKRFFDYRHLEFDGWLYPSAVSVNESCIAVDAEKCTQLLDFLFVATGKMETETDYTLEYPKILSAIKNKLFSITDLIQTGEINNYDSSKISEIRHILVEGLKK